MEAFYRNAHAIGTKVESRGGETTCYGPITLVYTPEESVQTSHFNPALAFVEATQILAGVTDRQAIAACAPKTFEQGYFDRSNVEYGERIGVQIPRLKKEWWDDPYSRRLVAVAGGDEPDPEERPCATSLQLAMIGEVMYLFVNMRSWDLVRGLPYNVIMWGVLAQMLQKYHDVKWCEIQIHATLAHIYEEDWHLVKFSPEGHDPLIKLGPKYQAWPPNWHHWPDIARMANEELGMAPWDKEASTRSWKRRPSFITVEGH